MKSGNDVMVQASGVTIDDWHAHVYFNPDEAEFARTLCEAMRDAFDVSMGRSHHVPVGPHPRGSCQIAVPQAKLGEALRWLAVHRGRLTIFVHGNSGDDWRDHTAHVIWLGESEQLDLGFFKRP